MVQFDHKKIKWILFDLSGVIVPFTFMKTEGYEYKSRFFRSEELERIFYGEEYKSYMCGMLSHEQVTERYIKKKHLDLTVEEFNELFKNDQRPMEGMLDLCSELSKKYKLALATNEGNINMKYKVEGSGVMPYLTKIVPSYILRVVKPDARFYTKLLKRIDAKPQECIFIDDAKRNVDAAEKVGIKSLLFTNTEKLKTDLVQLHIL